MNVELCQTSKMELFAKIVHSFKLLTIFEKSSILDGNYLSEVCLFCYPSCYTFSWFFWDLYSIFTDNNTVTVIFTETENIKYVKNK